MNVRISHSHEHTHTSHASSQGCTHARNRSAAQSTRTHTCQAKMQTHSTTQRMDLHTYLLRRQVYTACTAAAPSCAKTCVQARMCRMCAGVQILRMCIRAGSDMGINQVCRDIVLFFPTLFASPFVLKNMLPIVLTSMLTSSACVHDGPCVWVL